MKIYDKRICDEIKRHDFIGLEVGTVVKVSCTDFSPCDFVAIYVMDIEDNEYLLDIEEGILYDDIERYRLLEILDANLEIIDSFKCE